MNTLTLIGNLTADPELRAYESGTAYLSFTLAVNDRIPTMQNGTRTFKERTDFLRVNVPGPQAINCNKYLQKGSKIGIVGSVRSYSVGEGDDRRTELVIHADRVEFLAKIKTADTEAAPE